MSIEPYLVFNGNCREAVTFYAKAFHTPMGQIMTFGDGMTSGDFSLDEKDRERIMHTELLIAGSRVMFSDTLSGQPVTFGDQISLTVISEDGDALRSYFAALKVGGTVDMELQETFWSPCYGMVKDAFGISWQLSQTMSE